MRFGLEIAINGRTSFLNGVNADTVQLASQPRAERERLIMEAMTRVLKRYGVEVIACLETTSTK